jgi:CDGSH-type Zn-finger protein/uncharacterized Fe-S cluster protein YjdI
MTPKRAREYEGEGIVVEFEAARCIHAAECVRGLPAVFDPDARPWVQPANGDADAIAGVVRRCPSGALHARRTDGGVTEEAPEENTVRIVPDGPLYLRGRVRLELPSGEVREETRVALCRCGASRNKPFCDNAHRDAGFKDPAHVTDHRFGADPGGSARELRVKLAPDGPVLFEGPVRVLPTGGSPGEGGKGAFCRCGASSSKPYCDGTHTRIGFTSG